MKEETHWDLIRLFEEGCEKGEYKKLFLQYMGELFDAGLLNSKIASPRFYMIGTACRLSGQTQKAWDFLHEFVKAHRLEIEYEKGDVLIGVGNAQTFSSKYVEPEVGSQPNLED